MEHEVQSLKYGRYIVLSRVKCLVYLLVFPTVSREQWKLEKQRGNDANVQWSTICLTSSNGGFQRFTKVGSKTNVASQFSARERHVRNQGMSTKTVPGDVRVDFKDSLMSLFRRFIELQPPFMAPVTRRIFAISNMKAGGVQILIFISSMRLLLSSRHIVLDPAILPLTFELMPALIPYIQEVAKEEGVKEIRVNDKELRLWKEILPSFVERCRDCAHVPTCEY
jgi:hypothetical protein